MKMSYLILLVALPGFTNAPVACAANVWAWGKIDPIADSGQTNVPGGLTNAVMISAGQMHGVVLRDDGTVAAWGDNRFGQIMVPAGLSNVVAIDASAWHNLALKADGTVVAWGINDYGELNVPTNLVGVVAVAAGYGFSLALRANGTVAAWGFKGLGQCDVPDDLTNAVAISAGANCLALRANGTVAAWGPNFNGEIEVPPGLSDVIAVSAGRTASLALKRDGTVVAWGAANSPPPGLANVIAVSAGLALKADGTVVAWGDYTNLPAGLAGVTAISSDGNYFLALSSIPQHKITIQVAGPFSQTVAVGSQAFFSVAAVGPAPLSYQWYFGTNALAGATNRWLALYNVQHSQAGTYSVVVSNPQESVMSLPMTLSVVPALDIHMVPAITLTGAIGSAYRIDYINAVGPTNAWSSLATVTLTNSQQFYFDVSAIGQPGRFYRLVLVP